VAPARRHVRLQTRYSVLRPVTLLVPPDFKSRQSLQHGAGALAANRHAAATAVPGPAHGDRLEVTKLVIAVPGLPVLAPPFAWS
jgi:hypothetical protein